MKSLCTLPHILSGCKFSLNNGRWNYRHDRVLKVLLDGIEELLKKQKRTKAVPRKSSISFVKPGQSSVRRTNKAFGLLEKARDWVLLADIGDCKLIFPSEIFCTSERPDIVLYSSNKKTVILIENTSGCEENQSENHGLKTDKYRDLVEAIRGNGWVCHFFAIEVGARGFNSTHVPFCLKSLGFPPKSVKSLLGKLSRASLEASYNIWLARNDKEWKPSSVLWSTSFGCQNPPSRSVKTASAKAPSSPHLPVTAEKVTDPIDFVISPLPQPKTSVEDVSQSSSSSMSMADSVGGNSSLQQEKVLPVRPVFTPGASILFRRPGLGLQNLGNTCYANSALNCLFPFPELWDFPARLPLHQALKAILVGMNVQPRDHTKATPLRPRMFLEALADHISKVQKQRFCYKRQHDASEVLGFILDELFSAGVDKSVVCYSLSTSYRCQVCGTTKPSFFSDVKESILHLDVCESISTALLTRLSGDIVSVRCDPCQSNQQCVEQLSFSNLPDILIIRLRRDQFQEGRGSSRSGSEVECDRRLTIGSGLGECVSLATYQLVAVSHHSGKSLSSGHYTSTLVDPRPNRKFMWTYNDELVGKARTLDQRTAFILFYRKDKK